MAIAEHSLLGVDKTDAAKNPLSLLADRSPGGRGAGALLLTKAKPHERVLSSVRTRNPVGAGSPALADSSPGGLFNPEDIGSTPLRSPPQYFGTPYYLPPYSLVAETPPSTPTTPTSPIAAPEPATWMLMIFGLFGVTTLRRHRNKGAI